MGVSPETRTFTLPFDASIRVGVSGFACEPDQRTATMAELRPLMTAFDHAYEQLIAGPFRDGDDPDALVTALAQTPTGGFSRPQCPNGIADGSLVWQGEEGPPILMQTQFVYDDKGKPSLPPSASAEWLRLTAIQIDQSGLPILYFYAGYYS
jgi:hypothetical protein